MMQISRCKRSMSWLLASGFLILGNAVDAMQTPDSPETKKPVATGVTPVESVASASVTPAPTAKPEASKAPQKPGDKDPGDKALELAEKYKEIQRLKKRFEDPAFDRYVNIIQIGKAWDNLDSVLLADVSLQLAYAESVLQREHKKMTADMAMSLAVKLAIETADRDTLARLGKAADHYGKVELAEQIKAASELSLASRSAGMSISSLINVSASSYKLYQTYSSDLVRCRVSKDADLLARMESSKALFTLPENLRSVLQQQIAELREELSVDAPTSTTDSESQVDGETSDLPQMLRSLAQTNRAITALAKAPVAKQ